MNKQDIFNTIAVHLLRQGRKSTTDESGTGVCKYRGINGTSCAVGCLIPDDLYTREMEGDVLDLTECVWNKAEVDGRYAPLGELLSTHSLFLQEFQVIHDLRKVEEWKVQLQDLATIHNLSTEVLEKL